MRRFTALIGALAAGLVATFAVAAAGPTPGGFTSDNVEWVNYVPFELGTATGLTVRNDLAFVTSWRGVSIYDIADVRNPQLLSHTPFGFKFENEDVTGNDELLFFSESLPQSILHIYDVSDPTVSPLPKVAEVAGAGDHTAQCILNCEYVLGSDGSIVHVGQTVENAKDAKLLDENWHSLIELRGGNHDLELIDEGFVMTTPISDDFHILDVRDPLDPKVLGRGEHPDPANWLFHSGEWFNNGTDRFLLQQGEQNFQPQCGEGNGPLVLYEVLQSPFKDGADLSGAEGSDPLNGKEAIVELRDTYAVSNGTYQDGSPAVNALGCSAHWFDDQPDFKNGGLVAAGYYEHGTRFLEITQDAQLNEVGWFLPHAGSTSAAYWLDERTVWAVDYTRGIDILEWTGDIPGKTDEG